MKKILSFILIFIMFGSAVAHGDFQINTSIPLAKQQAFKIEIEKAYKKFEVNLNKLSLDAQISTITDVNSHIKKLFPSQKSDTNKFVLLYLGYILNEKQLELIKEKENNEKLCQNGYELVAGKCSLINDINDTKTDTNTGETIGEPSANLMFPDNDINTTMFLAGSRDQKILSFRVRASYDNIRLRDLALTGNGLENLNNFRLLTPSGAQISATSSTSTKVTFSSMDLKDTIARDTNATYNILADINNGTDGKTFNITLNSSGSTIISLTNGRTASFSPNSNNVSSHTYTIANNTTNASKVLNDSKNINTSALKFKVSAVGNDGITLAGATFNNILSGYDTTNARIAVYRNSASYYNLLGASATGVVTGHVAFTQNNLIDNGYTNTYIVAIEGVVINSSSSNTDWVVSMTDLETSTGIHFNNYSNLGEFPITEVK